MRSPRPDEALRLVSCESLVGEAVVDTKDEVLGSIADLMIDFAAGRIVYAVVARGGVLGLGEKLHTMPWEAFSRGADGCSWVLDIEGSSLDAAPALSREEVQRDVPSRA